MSALGSLIKRFTPKAFEAGRSKRRLLSIPTATAAINTQIRRYGNSVLARSRYLSANNPYAVLAKEAFVAALVGDGIKPAPNLDDEELKKQVAELWTDWTDEADADGLTDLYGLESFIAGELFEAGEVFVRIRPRRPEDGLTVPFQLQLLPSEMLPLEKNEAVNGNRVEMGIEFDAIGRRVAYHFRRRHPGSDLQLTGQVVGEGLSEFVRVPAEQVLHIYKPIRVGQLRGLPHTLSGLVTLACIDLYDDAELERKRIAALFGAFVTKPEDPDGGSGPLGVKTVSPGGGETNEEADNAFTLEPGAVVDLLPGEDIKFGAPADVGPNYDQFQYRNLLKAAAGFGVPYYEMTGDLRQTSYSSIRAGLVAFRRRISALQNHIVIFQFCRPIWARFMDELVLGQLIPLTADKYKAARKTYIRVRWIPPKWEWVDPLKDRQAELLAVRAGFKPRSDVQNEEGYDPEAADAQMMADNERADEAGLVLDSDPRYVSQAGLTQARPVGTIIPDPTLEQGDVTPPAPQGGDQPGNGDPTQ